MCIRDRYIESCYSSGIAEGTANIGGLVGTSSDIVYKNCYSTAAVGMDYSGNSIGGFVGIQNATNASLTINDYSSSSVASAIYVNCYSAGEVGDIITDTNLSTANGKGIGGFIGSSSTIDNIKCKNCYYDMQTSGMREVAYGGTSSNCQLDGVKGVYTKSSENKGVIGLTTTTGNYAINMQNDNIWKYNEGYYPQLSFFANNSDTLKKNYSLASTATIFLNHYDNIMDESGNIVSSNSKTIYDTVRDITSSFEFTSKDNSTSSGEYINWNVDSQKNKDKGYVESLDIKDGTNVVKNVPVLVIANPTNNNISTIDQKDIYKCYSFAPGKSWVKVEIGENNKGIRRIRLLPTAYLYAGESEEVSVKENDDRTVENNIYINGSVIENSKLNHSNDTIYAITSIENLGDSQLIYPLQITSKNGNTANLFAQWNTYPQSISNGIFDDMYAQALIGNSTPSGKAKVEVYKLGLKYKTVDTGNTNVDDPNVLIPEIDYSVSKLVTGDELDDDKWNGKKEFEISDKGWYELRYYWKLNDGRYLSDSKIVIIEGVDSTVNAAVSYTHLTLPTKA